MHKRMLVLHRIFRRLIKFLLEQLKKLFQVWMQVSLTAGLCWIINREVCSWGVMQITFVLQWYL